MLQDEFRPVHAVNPLVQIGDIAIVDALSPQRRRRSQSLQDLATSVFPLWLIVWRKTNSEERVDVRTAAHHNEGVVPGDERDQIEGWIPELASEDEIRGALEKAFDYRGDVTITRKDGSRVEGYIFDRRNGETLAESVVRIIPKTRSRRPQFHTLTSPLWRSADATWQRARAGKRG